MKRRVVVTGSGALTPVGNSVEAYWESLKKGVSGIGIISSINTDAYNCKVAAEVKGFDPGEFLPKKLIKKSDRFVQFAVATAMMAMKDCGLEDGQYDAHRFGVIVGSGIGGLHTVEDQCKVMFEKGPERLSPFLIPMLISNMAPGMISILLGLKGPNTCVATACATGTHSIGDAFRTIQYDDADIMIAGGTEACITAIAFGGFDKMSALSTHNANPLTASRPFDKERNGFVMGEGCGILVLEELSHALKRGAKIYCEVVGYGSNADANHMTQPHPEAEGPTRCILRAIRDADIKPEEIDYVNAHGTSTPMNDKVETLAIKRALGDHAKKVAISSTKSMTGHLLGASGGVEAIACALAIRDEIIPPTINYSVPDPDCDLDYVPNEARSAKVNVAISNSFGFGGHNATLCFRKYAD